METFSRAKLINRKVTIYFHGEMFGCIHKIEARSYFVQTGAYAQYSSAVACYFVPKGGRNPRGITQTFRPSLLILDGWGHPEPAAMFGAEETSGEGVTVSRSRHSAFASEWQTEFDATITAHVAARGAVILADFRGHNPHAPATAATTAAPAPATSPASLAE